MRMLLYITSALAVIGLAFWAYRENYETQRALAQSERLQARIGEARARLAVLRAEWAYLNRPERLTELAEINFADLALLPLRPDQFGKIDQVAYPLKPGEFAFTNTVEVSSANADVEAEGENP